LVYHWTQLDVKQRASVSRSTYTLTSSMSIGDCLQLEWTASDREASFFVNHTKTPTGGELHHSCRLDQLRAPAESELRAFEIPRWNQMLVDSAHHRAFTTQQTCSRIRHNASTIIQAVPSAMRSANSTNTSNTSKPGYQQGLAPVEGGQVATRR